MHRHLGPGAVHLMNGLYDASCDNQPVVASWASARAVGSDFQQELNMERLFGDVAVVVGHDSHADPGRG